MKSVSFIIPTYNGLALLKKHLPSVLASMRKNDELIVVDDASTDRTVTWLDALSNTKEYKDVDIKVLINQANLRFAASCNLGVASAKGEIVVLLNNDVSPEPDFLQFLVPHFDDPQVFAVGCRELASHEGKRAYGKSEASFQRGFYVHRRADDQESFGNTSWVAGGSGAFRASMWKTLGGFDLDFQPAYGEDIDLSYRAQQHGWKTLFEPRSVVTHVHESTNESVFGKQKIEIMSYKNAFLFMWKNALGMERIKHFLWLPYHFVFTTCRSRGRFLRGFFLAIRQLL